MPLHKQTRPTTESAEDNRKSNNVTHPQAGMSRGLLALMAHVMKACPYFSQHPNLSANMNDDARAECAGRSSPHMVHVQHPSIGRLGARHTLHTLAGIAVQADARVSTNQRCAHYAAPPRPACSVWIGHIAKSCCQRTDQRPPSPKILGHGYHTDACEPTAAWWG